MRRGPIGRKGGRWIALIERGTQRRWWRRLWRGEWRSDALGRRNRINEEVKEWRRALVAKRGQGRKREMEDIGTYGAVGALLSRRRNGGGVRYGQAIVGLEARLARVVEGARTSAAQWRGASGTQQ
jgi:hypothetical protein